MLPGEQELTKTVTLGDIHALGPDGLAEVMATHAGLNGVVLPPLATVERVVDSTNFPGLAPELEIGERGVVSVLAAWTGPNDALRLSASIHLIQHGTLDNRVISVIEGHAVAK